MSRKEETNGRGETNGEKEMNSREETNRGKEMNGRKETGINRKAARYFAVFMVVMLAFTVISRAADSLLVPQVATEAPSAKVIEHTVKMEAVVEASAETPVFAEEGILVESVFVKEGSQVEAGDVLAEVLPESLAEKIDVLSDEIAALKLTNEALAANEAAQEAAREKNAARASEDYDRTVQQQMNDVALAKSGMDAAENAIHEMEAQDMAGAFAGMDEQEKKQKSDALWTDFFAKKAAYEAAVQNAQAAADIAERAVEDAREQTTVDNTQEINALSIAREETELKALVALQENGGKITVPVGGTVTGVFAATGQRTPDTASFLVAQAGENIRLTAQISKDDVKYVSVGDEAAVQKGTEMQDGYRVSAVQQKQDGSYEVSIVCEENAKDTGEKAENWNLGGTVEVTVTKQSKRYSVAVPTAALHVEQNGTYVYVVDERDSVLGAELFARKVQVSVLEKNSQYAAVAEGLLGGEDQVIVDSDRYVEEGSRVRLAEQ